MLPRTRRYDPNARLFPRQRAESAARGVLHFEIMTAAAPSSNGTLTMARALAGGCWATGRKVCSIPPAQHVTRVVRKGFVLWAALSAPRGRRSRSAKRGPSTMAWPSWPTPASWAGGGTVAGTVAGNIAGGMFAPGLAVVFQMV